MDVSKVKAAVTAAQGEVNRAIQAVTAAIQKGDSSDVGALKPLADANAGLQKVVDRLEKRTAPKAKKKSKKQ